LPQLIRSAGCVQEAFRLIKLNLDGKGSVTKGKVLLATVEGDIHDIGKNIVKVLLENYGFQVIDLGKDVSKEIIMENVINNDIELVGLSALMTTTVKNMKETIRLINKNKPSCKIFVGGAVLTEEYAKDINADYYCKDAQASVRVTQDFFKL
jgi:5-methyltetrahydrofolate--homocysteine methyltransferase